MQAWNKWLVKILIAILSGISRLSPLRGRWGFGVFLAWLWFDVFRLRRYTVLRNLSIAFPEWSPEKKYSVARQSLRYLCYNFPELLLLPTLSRKDIGKSIFFHGWDLYESVMKKNKGLLILTLHLGNGDVGVSALAMNGVPIHLISKKFSNPLANEFWFSLRGAQGAKFIDPHGPKIAFEILGACRKNEPVVFVIDQFMGKPFGIESRFFGRKTGTAKGLALFAVRTGAPVMGCYTYHDEKFNTHVVFTPEIPMIDLEDREQQVTLMTQKYNDVIQDLVCQHPEQWMWLHRRWKHFK